MMYIKHDSSEAMERARCFDTRSFLGFKGGDANLYRYVGNNVTNSVDPTGLFQEVKAPHVIGELRYGVRTGTLVIPIRTPTPPKGLHTYTEIDWKWTIEKIPDKAKIGSVEFSKEPRKGEYYFWFNGMTTETGNLLPDELRFNLDPWHSSHRAFSNTHAPWPIFQGTRGEKIDAHQEYMAQSLNIENTRGTLNIKIAFRGYPQPSAHKFNPALESEKGGPTEVPTLISPEPGRAKVPYAPNRLRSLCRTKLPWSSNKPDIWANKPQWEHLISIDYSWDWSNPTFGKYRIEVTGEPAREGTTPYPNK